MKHDSAQLWDNFKISLAQSIKETPIETLGNAWNSNANRTEFYLGLILPKVADKLKLGYEREKTFRVDGVFFKKAENGYHVPIVFVESENNSGDTKTEIYKLCCLNAPLKVIFICCEWNENTRQKITEQYWQHIIDAFVKENCLAGHLGVIVAEWMDTLKFHSFAYNDKGIIADREKILCEIE